MFYSQHKYHPICFIFLLIKIWTLFTNVWIDTDLSNLKLTNHGQSHINSHMRFYVTFNI